MSARPLSIYVHVPFCATRCGYCDFNTYTATELGDSVSRATFHEVLITEIHRLATTYQGPVSTVFVGGGTPTLLGDEPLIAILQAIDESFGLSPDAEVTTEANPDSVNPAMLANLRSGGFTRISLGMQSAAEGVLAVLERTHTPGRSAEMAQAARRAGFEHVNLDLIYGTPGERNEDLLRSLAEVLDSGVDHVSAYALIVESGTPLARRIARGEIPPPDDDIAAERYCIVDDALTDAGFTWYEVSNWARAGAQCRHNRAYWSSADWLGVGPGAHSHVAGHRWWNLKHPRSYAEAVDSAQPTRAGEEHLSVQQRHMEHVMLTTRLRDGLPLVDIGLDSSAASIVRMVRDERIDPVAVAAGRVVLTRRGRLLADAVIRELLEPAH